MNPAKRVLVRTQKFVVDHKVAIAVATTAVVTTVVVKKACSGTIESMRDFIEREGLLDKFNETFNDVTY